MIGRLMVVFSVIFSLSTLAGRTITVTGSGYKGVEWNPLCIGVRSGAKKEAKLAAKSRCELMGGRYLSVLDSDSNCDRDAGGACGCSADVTIECEL